jgi:hypothetical protein
VFESSIVVGELDGTVVMTAPEGVCTDVTSPLDRLRLDMGLPRETRESDDSEGDEVTKDSVTDREDVKPVDRVVRVTS